MVRKISKKNQNKNKNENLWSNLRLLLVGVIATLGFFIVVGHLVILQFVEGKELAEKAYNQQVKNRIISPNRGTIYDSKGEVLAQSIPVDTVSVNPDKLTYANSKEVPKEVIAEGLSNIFNVTYEDMMQKLQSGKSVFIVEKKVEKDKIDQLNEWMKNEGITAGINIDEDSKRYYPYEDLASNLIGFCGTDNSGQTGLEERWNEVLTGTAGKVVTITDVHKNAISDEDEQYIPSENGSNIYLTIDTTIQAIVEKYLENAVKENPSSTGGSAIMMNPQTGEILAMATYPDYNLNSPSDYTKTGYEENEWKALEQTERSTRLLELWKNRVVSDTYEPGSTFKLITASVGLEEGIVETDTPGNFFCSGSYVVGKDTEGKDIAISCWRSYQPHGAQSLRDALENSCNPAFMQLGQKIGAGTLYKYYQAFGFFDNVGGNIAKSYPGTFYKLEEIGPVELATMSFGQRFEISPLQLVTAVSAICNDGKLVEPKIVKEIENTDTGSKEVVETKEVRQVISKATADKVKELMQSVVTDGTGRHAAVEGFSIGGKSGTSEPPIGREDEGYVASFIAISPIENTQVVTLVTLNGLSESANHQGGQVAGPVCQLILREALPKLGIASNATTSEVVEEEDEEIPISIPNVKDYTVAEATAHLQNLGFNVICNLKGDPNTTKVVDQMPKFGTALRENSVICLYSSENEERVKVQVPNVKEMPVEQAINVLKAHNLNVQIDGTQGIVVSQDPTYEKEVEEGTVINIVIKEKLKDAQ